MRKLISAFLGCLVLSCLIFAAPVQVWSTFSAEQNRIYQELTDEYFIPQTGIEVQITSVPYDGYEQKYLLAAVSGDMPEIGVSGSLGPADLGVRGAAIDLKERYKDAYSAIRQQMYPGLMRSLDYMGTAFGLPIKTNLYPMMVRTDILADLGMDIPVTWNDLYADLPKLQAQKMNFATAFGIGSAVYADISMFVWQRGGDWYSDDLKRSGLDSDEAIEAFVEFSELFTKHNIPKEINFYMDFTTGAIPLMTAPFWEYSALVFGAPEIKGKWTLAKVPGTKQNDGTINHAAYMGGETLFMFKGAPRSDDAFKWAEWFLSEEIQALIANIVPERISGGLFIPAHQKAILEVPLPKEHVTVLMEQAKASVAPAFALAPESITSRYFNFMANKVVLQNADPKDAILEAAKEMNAELSKKQREFERFIKNFSDL